MKKVKVNLNLAEKTDPRVYYYGNSCLNLLTKLVAKTFRPASTLIVPLLASLGVTPNQVTVTSAIVNFGLAGFCFSRGTYIWNLTGAFFLVLHQYFDFVDGSLARSTNQKSKLGQWLDRSCDYFGSAVILISLCYGVYRDTADSFWLIIAVLLIFAKYAISIAHVFYGNFFFDNEKFQGEYKNDKKMTYKDWLVKEFLIHDTFLFLFIYTIAYSLFFAIVFNVVPFYLVAITFFYNLRWFVLILAYAKVLKKEKGESRIIKLLRTHINGIVFDEKQTG